MKAAQSSGASGPQAPVFNASRRNVQHGPGDCVNIQAIGLPDVTATGYASDDRRDSLSLAGPVRIARRAAASRLIELALEDRMPLDDRRVPMSLTASRSQRANELRTDIGLISDGFCASVTATLSDLATSGDVVHVEERIS